MAVVFVVYGTHRAQQERELRGYSWLNAGSPVLSPNVGPQTCPAIVSQEQPPYYSAQFAVGLPVVVPPATTQTAIIKQEQPPYYTANLQSGLPLVLSAKTRAVITKQEQPPYYSAQFAVGLPIVVPPIRRSILTTLEQPPYYAATFLIGLPLVEKAETRAVIIKQEQPPYYNAQFAIGLPLVVSPSVTRTAIIRQEPVPYYGAALQGGIPLIVPPVRRQLITAQEPVPYYLAVTVNPVQGPNVAGAGVVGSAYTKQELPFHPLPFTFIGSLYVSLFSPLVTNVVLTSQELPFHPLPAEKPGIQGPNVGSGITNVVLKTQETPFHPLPASKAGVQGPNVGRSIGSFFVRQEYPERILPFIWNQFFVPVPPLFGTQITPRQDMPERIVPFVWNLVFPPAFAASAPILIKQEQPPYYSAFERPGVQGPNVGRGIGSFYTRQEQPYHPNPWALGVILNAPVFAPPFTGSLILKQEQPWHPSSMFINGVQVPVSAIIKRSKTKVSTWNAKMTIIGPWGRR